MNVLFITGSYPPMKCGVGMYTQKLACALAEFDDVRLTVLTDTRARDNDRIEKSEVLPVMKGWGITELIRIVHYVRQLRPDVVHIQSPSMGYPGRIPLLLPSLIRLLGIPTVQTWHEPVVGVGGLWLSIGLKVLITVREELLSSLPVLTRKALHRVPFFWIPAGSMLPTVSMSKEERSVLRRPYSPDDRMLLTYYGFVAPLKGLEILLEIVAATDVHLSLACDLQSENSYHNSLLEKIKSMGLESRVTIVGFLQEDQLAKHLAAADAVVLPFRDGARDCNTSVEGASSQGTFVLTTSLLHHGYNKDKNIYYSKPGDVNEMINAIRQYAGCRNDHYVPETSWGSVSEKHRDIYQQMVSK